MLNAYATSAIRVATDAYFTKDKVYLARLVACLATIFFAEDYVLLHAMRNTTRADAYVVDVVADPEFVAQDASNNMPDATSIDDIDDDCVVYAARAVDAAYVAAAAYDRVKAAIILDKAALARINAAATHANVVAASANAVDAYDKVTTEVVAHLAKAAARFC